METTQAFAKARRSLEGLSMGDAFGELFFSISPDTTSSSQLPNRPWRWTDDTHMALSIVEILKTYGCIEQDALAKAFARRYQEEPFRGYAFGAARLLWQVAMGADWRIVSPSLFHNGSYGNGAAMRAAPIGGFFHGDPKRAAQEAQRSAVITHSHPEGQAGAIAVAVAAALVSSPPYPSGRNLLEEVMVFVPDSMVRQGIELALEIPHADLKGAGLKLGTGNEVSAQDTVPFCLWSAAYHLEDFEEALWQTAKGMGDCDTTCAIVGGIVALSAPSIPETWLKKREPLPEL
jgi:ADP-ribosylglycohydrolase